MPNRQAKNPPLLSQESEDPVQQQSKRRLIIGIDKGTTRFVVASAICPAENAPNPDPVDTDIRRFSQWTGSFNVNSQFGPQLSYYPPSALLYETPGELPKTGHDLKALLNKRIPKVNLDLYFPLWKLMFHDHMGDPTTKRIQESMQNKLDKLGKTREDLVQDWVAVIYNRLIRENGKGFSMLESVWGEPLSNFDIEIVVAVPPGRGVIDHDAIFKAYVQMPIRAHQVFQVAEPEAMFCSWVALESRKHVWKLGKTYIVADGGGGTCCWIKYRLVRLDPPGFVQQSMSRSVVCGSETISAEFFQLADAKLSQDFQDREWTLNQMQLQFDEYCKYGFGSSPERDYYDDLTGIKFTFKEIKNCFEGCALKLIQGTEQQLQQGNSPTDYILLGGGLFTNDFIFKKMQDAFRNRSTIIQIENDKQHVANGAVLTRLTSKFKSFITMLASPLSHSVSTRERVTREIRSSPLYPYLRITIDPNNGFEYYDTQQWLVKKGEEVVPGHELDSESTYESARTHGIRLRDPDLDFEDRISSVDWHPGPVSSTPVGKDGGLIDNLGNPVGHPYQEATVLKWNPKKLGVSLSNLQLVSRYKTHDSHHIIRYSIQMRCENAGTYYWVKIWAQHRKVNGTRHTVLSIPVRSEPVIQCQNISEGLAISQELGSGMLEDHDCETALPYEPSKTASRERTVPSEDIEAGLLNRERACWTCESRGRACPKDKPSCAECVKFGIGHLCQYVRPENLTDFRREILTAIKTHAERASKKRCTPSSRAFARGSIAEGLNFILTRPQTNTSISGSTTPEPTCDDDDEVANNIFHTPLTPSEQQHRNSEVDKWQRAFRSRSPLSSAPVGVRWQDAKDQQLRKLAQSAILHADGSAG